LHGSPFALAPIRRQDYEAGLSNRRGHFTLRNDCDVRRDGRGAQRAISPSSEKAAITAGMESGDFPSNNAEDQSDLQPRRPSLEMLPAAARGARRMAGTGPIVAFRTFGMVMPKASATASRAQHREGGVQPAIYYTAVRSRWPHQREAITCTGPAIYPVSTDAAIREGAAHHRRRAGT